MSDYFAKSYCLGGRYICLSCQHQKCRETTHQRIFLGPKFKIPKKNNQRAWEKLRQQVNSGQVRPNDFYAPAVEFHEYKELYRDLPRRRSKLRRANYDIGYPKSNYHPPIINGWGYQEREEYYSTPSRWQKMQQEEMTGKKYFIPSSIGGEIITQ